MSITQFIVKLTSFIYCGSIYLFLGTYLDFFEKNYKPKFSDTYNILCLIGIMIFNCEYPSEGLNYNSDINNVRMWIILFLY